MFIKVCQGYHKHYDKKVSYYYMIFLFFSAFKKIDKQHGGVIFERFFSEPESSMEAAEKILKDFLVSQRAAWGWCKNFRYDFYVFLRGLVRYGAR